MTPGDFSKVCNQDTMIVLLNCEQDFPDTVVGDSTTLTIKLKNKGWPVDEGEGHRHREERRGADDLAFFLDRRRRRRQPRTPSLMSQADGSDVLPLTIRSARTWCRT